MKKRMIFIVDDSRTEIELTIIALEATGLEMSVCSATDGMSALEFLRDGRCLPDLILLDLKMAGMNGLDVLREIRADSLLRKIPVAVVTSSSLESDRTAAIAAGASDYLQKPWTLGQFSEDLKSVLHRWLPN
ncbi:MAG TPA: response regulator [Dissulfurispiraceae bacterium]|nr:response regulator [Dissulfurispiraceae bacterium]